MKLIDNWRDAWRFSSVWAMTAATAIQGAWIALPLDLRTTLPPWLPQTIAIALLLLGIFARIVKQKNLSGGKSND